MLYMDRDRDSRASMGRDPPNPVPGRGDFAELVRENGSLLTRGRSISRNNSAHDNCNFSNNIGDEEGKKIMNFSHFLGLNYALINESNGTISPKDVEMDKPSVCVVPGINDNDVVVEAVREDYSLVPYEHSQAIGGINNLVIEDRFDHQVPGPDSSIGGSSAPMRKFKRIRIEESESAHLDELDDDEETEDQQRRSAPQYRAAGSTGNKRSRSATHKLSEKKRRDRINKRIRALQELLPNCNKVDKASVLDEAIEYMKALQLQLQIMSTGNQLFASSMAMLPPAGILNQIPMPFLNQFPPVGAGMGLRMGPGFLQGPAHPFQPMAFPPYIPVLGGHPAMRPLMNGSDLSGVAAAAMIDRLVSAPVSGSTGLNQKVGHDLDVIRL